MLLPLFEYLSEFFGPFRVVEFLSTRAILATLTSLLFSLLLGPKFINKMKDIQVQQVVRAEGPETHLSKQGTPTMGGTLIPVSYTHLRAHETCADLVCRLLLEKKELLSLFQQGFLG